MDEKKDPNVSAEVMRELRNDFTFFVSMSMLKSLAVSSPEPASFIKDIIWKWRELQVNALGMIVADHENKMFFDAEFNELFGDLLKKINRAQRETMIASIRAFCDSMEKVLISNLDSQTEGKEEDFTG